MPSRKKSRKAHVTTETSSSTPHRLKKDVRYCLWNLFSGGLIVNNLGQVHVHVNGQKFDSNDSKIQSKDAGLGQFYLVFNSATDQYITAKASGQDITLTDSPDQYAKFKPIYNGNYTLYRCEEKSDSANNVSMYLGSDDAKSRATLVRVKESSYANPAMYPDPRTLFINTTI